MLSHCLVDKCIAWTSSLFPLLSLDLAAGRLALTPHHMLEVARHGALVTSIKVLEGCMVQPETIAVVCGFVASLLSMPDVNVEGLNFRYTEALSVIMEKHTKHFELKCMVSGCYMQVAETYKFIQVD